MYLNSIAQLRCCIIQQNKASACPEGGQPKASYRRAGIHPQAGIEGVSPPDQVCSLIPLAALHISNNRLRRMAHAHYLSYLPSIVEPISHGKIAGAWCPGAELPCSQSSMPLIALQLMSLGPLTDTVKPVVASTSNVQPWREVLGENDWPVLSGRS